MNVTQVQAAFLQYRESSESIIKERVLIPYSFKSMVKEFGLSGRRMIGMSHFAGFDQWSTSWCRPFPWLEATEPLFDSGTGPSTLHPQLQVRMPRSSRKYCGTSCQGYSHFENYFQCSQWPRTTLDSWSSWPPPPNASNNPLSCQPKMFSHVFEYPKEGYLVLGENLLCGINTAFHTWLGISTALSCPPLTVWQLLTL